jgi:hypothetical protein
MEAGMPAAAVHALDPWKPAPGGWPIARASLAALKDLGLSDRQIASYFRVRQEDVSVLRATYGIAEHAAAVRYPPPPRRRFTWRRRG